MSVNVGEYGQMLYANIGENVTGATEYTVILEPQVGETKTKTTANGVALGTANITVGDQQYLANQYLEYITVPDDIDYEGQWQIKGAADMSPTQKIIGDYARFTALA